MVLITFKMQTDNNLLANNFTNQFNQYMNDMNTGDALKQLSALESANKSISNQFTFSEKEPNILTDAEFKIFSRCKNKYLNMIQNLQES